MIKKIFFIYSVNFYSIENNQLKKNKTSSCCNINSNIKAKEIIDFDNYV